MKKRILFILLAVILLFSTRSYGMSEADQTKESFMKDFGVNFKYTEIEGSSERSGNIDAKNHYYQIEDNGEMVISEKGELMIYNTIDLDRPIFNENIRVNRAGKQKEEMTESSLNQWNEKEDFKEIEHLLGKYIPDDFVLQESRPVFEHEWELFYGVERDDGIVNPYHGIKILIDRTDGRLLSFYRYKGELPEGLEIIEEEVARQEAEQNIKEKQTLEFVELRVIDEDFLPEEDGNHEPIAYGTEKALYLVYVYQSSEGEIYIDAINGEIFSINEYESYGSSF